MYVDIYMYILHIQIYLSTLHICVCIHTCIATQTCIQSFIHTYIHTYTYIYIHTKKKTSLRKRGGKRGKKNGRREKKLEEGKTNVVQYRVFGGNVGAEREELGRRARQSECTCAHQERLALRSLCNQVLPMHPVREARWPLHLSWWRATICL